MENKFAPYECQFTIEERKHLIAEAIQETRKSKGYSQKEVASLLGLSQPRYSGYENGRSEIPAEFLVRLSYLYGTSVDTLVQRDRQHKTLEAVFKDMADYRKQIDELKAQIASTENPDPKAQNVLSGFSSLLDMLEKAAGETGGANQKAETEQ